MWWDTTKDYMNSFLGALVILITLITIKEIYQSKPRIIASIVIVAILVFLGFDKIKRDNIKDEAHDQQHAADTVRIKNIESLLNKDTLRFSEFKKELYRKFKISDSANIPIMIQTNNTHINSARDVYIGTR